MGLNSAFTGDKFNRCFASGAHKTRFPPMALDRKTTIRALHDPACFGKTQTMTARRRASNFARFLPPNRIMAMMWPNKRMRNFMQNRIANMVVFGIADIKPRKRNDLCVIITLTGAPPRMIKLDSPSGQAMLPHQFGRCFNRTRKWPMDGLFRL